ncbi:MAG: lipopolysaccharide heptosyltransferase II [Planctomycetia bacterium]|nr:lipopolysaccharide heptosyltransferase II [Planctomycetia bacterium]MCC7314581.1 lipopolysaccharide heptosyltransferase II [Planctomycetota bacterium]
MMTPRSILISVPNWVGDVVMATAAMNAIRRAFPQARIVHLMRRYVVDVLAHSGLADENVYWPDTQSEGGYLALLRRLRADRFDLAALFTNSFRSAALAWMTGARRRVGYARDGRGSLLTDGLKPVKQNGAYTPVPALDYYNEIARHLGCGEPGDRLVLATGSEDEAAVDRRIGPANAETPLVVLNPGANYGSAKCWPAEKYAALAAMMTQRYGARVVASLAPKEKEIADRLAAAATSPIDIFVEPPLGLGPLKALVKRASLLVTNDTGPRHFAAAFDVPVVTVFGSSDPAWTETRHAGERIAKLSLECQPCMERVCPLKHHKCMVDLSADQVFAEVERLWAARIGPARDKASSARESVTRAQR